MAIENIMYFALGFLLAALASIITMPSVWKRAVRLTKKRIEAATPITMAEFRADKDQLRAEFALSSHRLEKNIETLRTRLTEQVSELNTRKSAVAIYKAERDQQTQIAEDLQKHYDDALERIVQLEKQGARLELNLRERTRDLSALANQEHPPQDKQTRTKTAIASIKQALSFGEKDEIGLDGISRAHAQISNAGSHLDALLEETGLRDSGTTSKQPRSLADELSQDDELKRLRENIVSVEKTIFDGWDSGKTNKPNLRQRLGEIASSVSQLVYSVDSDTAGDAEESLFDRIRKFAGDGFNVEELDNPPASDSNTREKSLTGTTLSDRIAAFEDIHANN